VVLLARAAARRGRRAAAALAVLLVGTVAWITALPGPGVGPLPATGLISVQPDVYLALVVLLIAVAAGWLARGKGGRHTVENLCADPLNRV